MKTAIAIFTLLGCVSAFAAPGILISQTVSGNARYCKYSNGQTLVIANYEMCPANIQ